MSVFGSCSDDAIEQQTVPPTEETHVVTLTAGFDKGKTRSTISEIGQFSWLPGDMIKVLSTNGTFYDFKFDGEEQATRGSFSGSIAGTQTTYAVSPASIAPENYTGDALVLNLPASFTSVDKQANAPMVARFEEGVATGLQFKNVAGMMMIYVINIPAGTFNLEVSSANQQLSGSFTVKEDAEGNLAIEAAESSNNNKISIAYSGNDVDKRGFYIPLPVGTYKDLKVKFTSGSDVWFSKTAREMTVERNQIIIMPTITCGNSPSTKQETVGNSENTASDINSKLEEAAENQDSEGGVADLNITIVGSSSAEGTPEDELVSTVEINEDVVIPEAITNAEPVGDETPSVYLTFDAVPTSTNTVEVEGEVVTNVISITDNTEAQEEAQESRSEVQIAIPSIEVEVEGEIVTDAEAPSFNINLPTSTVTLSAKGESALYDVVIANTAENTLRVDKGVTINRVIVGTGNVLLKGTIGDIVSGSGKTIYVTLEEGAEITGTVSDNVIIIDNRYPMDNGEVALEFDNESTADGINVPYEISRLSQLRRMSLLVNGGHENKNKIPYYKCNYKLVSDIVVSAVENWEPIGSEGAPFRGTFEGANHSIRADFKITSNIRSAGLFGYIERATIKNLTMSGSVSYNHMTSDNIMLGAVVGYMRDGSIIENCINKAAVTNKSVEHYTDYVAGIVGYSFSYGKKNEIIACGNEGVIKGMYISTGIVAQTYGTNISMCYNTTDLLYGITGFLYDNSMILSCWSYSLYIGGWYSSVMSNCYTNEAYSWVVTNSYCNNCGTYYGDIPGSAQIKAMNDAGAGCGWEFDSNAKPVKSDKTGIPSNPVQTW